jgi:hypothetical protein
MKLGFSHLGTDEINSIFEENNIDQNAGNVEFTESLLHDLQLSKTFFTQLEIMRTVVERSVKSSIPGNRLSTG